MTSRRLLELWHLGELERLARDTTNQRAMCAALGTTPGAYRGAVRRARADGHEIPTYEQLRGQSAPDAESRGDFDGEDATVPGVTVEWGRDYANHATVQPIESTRPAKSGVRDPFTRHLNRADVPDGSIIAVLSDIHIPHHDADAMRLVIECCEDAGATHVILNGDIADCGPSSRHEEKRKREILMNGDLRRSVEPGRWIYDWARTKRCFLVRGNHEGWVENEVKGSPTAHGSTPERLMGLPDDGDGWEVLPMLSRVRLGNRVWEHGDGFFKTGSPGSNPGGRVRSKAPDQTTSIGHCHIKHASFWTTEDEYGITRTRAAFFNGHLSRPEAHGEYAGSYLQWQQSFELTRVYWVDGRPRFTTDQPEIHRDKNGRPIFEYAGKIYGRVNNRRTA